MPLLLLALEVMILAVTVCILLVATVLLGWLRQDRVIRRMRRETAERAVRGLERK